MKLDIALTSKVYSNYSLDDSSQKDWDEFKSENKSYFEKLLPITIDTGIDFDKPWELSKLDNYTVIEYFCAGMMDEESIFLNHDYYGINLWKTSWPGEASFGTDKILCFAVVVGHT